MMELLQYQIGVSVCDESFPTIDKLSWIKEITSRLIADEILKSKRFEPVQDYYTKRFVTRIYAFTEEELRSLILEIQIETRKNKTRP